MAIFRDEQQMYEVLGDLWRHVISDTEFGAKLEEYKIDFKFDMKDPDGYIWVGHDRVLLGSEAQKPAVITMELSSESAHKFWLKQLSLPVALATRRIKSKGPIPKVLKILPSLGPVYELYPEFCKKHGVSL